jgi:RNA polymerase sigma-70 factor (ECF subfamily)
MRDTVDSDEQLMERIRAGDRGPLGILLGRWATPLWTFLMRMLGERRRAEELFGEVFLALWIHRRRYAYPRPFCIWLFEIAAKKSIHRLHRRRRRAGAAGSSSRPLPPAGPTIAVPGEADAEAVVSEALLRVPSRERAVLVLRIWNELSYAEIAQVTGRHEALVRAQMTDALVRLRRHWERRRPARSVAEEHREC